MAFELEGERVGDAQAEETPSLEPSDPRYRKDLLGEDPSMVDLLRDREVARAIDSGRPTNVHAALKKKLSTLSRPAARARLRELLAQSRHFAEPIQGAPGLG